MELQAPKEALQESLLIQVTGSQTLVAQALDGALGAAAQGHGEIEVINAEGPAALRKSLPAPHED